MYISVGGVIIANLQPVVVSPTSVSTVISWGINRWIVDYWIVL